MNCNFSYWVERSKDIGSPDKEYIYVYMHLAFASIGHQNLQSQMKRVTQPQQWCCVNEAKWLREFLTTSSQWFLLEQY